MKFRILFILFNFVVIASFALIVFMPIVVLGTEYSAVFWRANWPVAIVFVVVLAGLNTYFGLNRRLFLLLERENWPELIVYLEEQVIARQRPTRQRIRVLANAYLITRNLDGIRKLEDALREQDDKWISRFPLVFGAPRLLAENEDETVRFFAAMKEDPRCPEPVWVRWNLAYGLFMTGRVDECRSELHGIVGESRRLSVKVLTAFLLSRVAADDKLSEQTAERIRGEVAGKYDRQRLDRELERSREGIQDLIFGPVIRTASDWILQSPGENDE